MSLYRIQAVSKLSGVAPATLRAWERRYGVPTPARTASAYRLYSEDDIALICKMRDLVSTGTSAAEAARIVLDEQRSGISLPPDEEVDPYAQSRDRIIAATIRFDPDALEQEVARALTLGPAVTIFERVIAPTLQQIGQLWHDDVITIAQEHLTSQLLGTIAMQLVRLMQPADATRRIALACFADEDHAIGLAGVALRFASWGFRPFIIGPRTPPAALARAVESLAPDVVGLSVSAMPPAPYARQLVDGYADGCAGTVWVVGGAGAAPMRGWVEGRGGIVWDHDMPTVRRTIERALRAKRR